MDTDDYLTYEEFGRKFFEVAVTEERVGGAIAAIAGDEFEMGPMEQGPGGIAKVTARVKIQGTSGDAEGRRDDQLRDPDPPSRSTWSSTCGSTGRNSSSSVRSL